MEKMRDMWSMAATGNGQTGQLPPREFLQTWWRSLIAYEKFFLETVFLLRELLNTIFKINQSMYHISENSQHKTGDKLWGVNYETNPSVSWRCETNPSVSLRWRCDCDFTEQEPLAVKFSI